MAALLLPALANAKEHARRIKCLANVKQIDLAFVSYAFDNKNRLPVLVSCDWASHIDISLTDLLLQEYGVTRNIMYCPSYPEFNNDTFWNNTGGADWGPHRVIGYCTFLASTHTVISNYWNTNLDPKPVQVALPRTKPTDPSFGIIWTQPSTVTLVADMIPWGLSAYPTIDTNIPTPGGAAGHREFRQPDQPIGLLQRCGRGRHRRWNRGPGQQTARQPY